MHSFFIHSTINWWPKSIFSTSYTFNMIFYLVSLLYFVRLQIPIFVYKIFILFDLYLHLANCSCTFIYINTIFSRKILTGPSWSLSSSALHCCRPLISKNVTSGAKFNHSSGLAEHNGNPDSSSPITGQVKVAKED